MENMNTGMLNNPMIQEMIKPYFKKFFMIPLMVSFVLMNLIDYILTINLIGIPELFESNPFMNPLFAHSPVIAFFFKFSLVSLIVFMTYILYQKSLKGTVISLLIINLMYLIIVINNFVWYSIYM